MHLLVIMGFQLAGEAIVAWLGTSFPAGAAVMGFGALLLSDGVAIAASLILSTGLAILVGGLVFGARHSFTLERSGGQP